MPCYYNWKLTKIKVAKWGTPKMFKKALRGEKGQKKEKISKRGQSKFYLFIFQFKFLGIDCSVHSAFRGQRWSRLSKATKIMLNNILYWRKSKNSSRVFLINIIFTPTLEYCIVGFIDQAHLRLQYIILYIVYYKFCVL